MIATKKEALSLFFCCMLWTIAIRSRKEQEGDPSLAPCRI